MSQLESLGLLVQAIQEGNASDINQLFDKLMVEKIADLVEYKKAEIAEKEINELSKNTLKSYIRKSANSATQLRDKAKNQEKKSLEYNAKAFSGSKEARIKSDTWANKAKESREKANIRLNHRMNAMEKLKASK